MSQLRSLIKAMRPHQWSKNVLIFLPWILGHWFHHLPLLGDTVLAFICFCLMASAVYILNDWADQESDRKHPTKCLRPIASGQLSVGIALWMALAFFIISLLLSFWVSPHLFAVLLTYMVITCAYSFYLKRLILVDVFILAVLYTLRLFAGMALLPVGYSKWLIIFSFFFFLGLAFAKRFVELEEAYRNKRELSGGRAYTPENWLLIKMFGICSAFISVLVFALYLSSQKAIALYAQPQIMYGICPLLLYWLARIWWIASEGRLHDDPVVYAIKDRASYVVLVLMIILGVFAWI